MTLSLSLSLNGVEILGGKVGQIPSLDKRVVYKYTRHATQLRPSPPPPGALSLSFKPTQHMLRTDQSGGFCLIADLANTKKKGQERARVNNFTILRIGGRPNKFTTPRGKTTADMTPLPREKRDTTAPPRHAAFAKTNQDRKLETGRFEFRVSPPSCVDF